MKQKYRVVQIFTKDDTQKTILFAGVSKDWAELKRQLLSGNRPGYIFKVEKDEPT